MLSSELTIEAKRRRRRGERSARRMRRRTGGRMPTTARGSRGYHLAVGYDHASRPTSMSYTGGTGTSGGASGGATLAAYHYV